MNIFEKIDRFLLEKVFQKFSDGFQGVTGLTCFFLAKTFAFATWAMVLLSILAVISITGELRILLVLVSFICLAALWVLVSMWDRKEKELSAKEGVKNPTAYYGFIARIMALFLFLSDFIPPLGADVGQKPYHWHLKAAYLFLVLALYFSACTSFPPGKKRQKEIDNLSCQET
jgi:hypothetical protein